MCPLSRLASDSGRSRFTRDPARRSPRLLRRSVSGARSAVKDRGCRSTAVRHTPFTAMLEPSRESSSTRLQWTFRRAPLRSTTPSSSMIPVNIPFHGEFVFGDTVQNETADSDCIHPPPPARPTRHGQRCPAAQNLPPLVQQLLSHVPPS